MDNIAEKNEKLLHSIISQSNKLMKTTQNILDENNALVQDMPHQSKIISSTIFVRLAQGGFIMGSDEYVDEKPRHHVNINHIFFISKYQVSIKEYLEFVQETGSNYPEWLNKNNKNNIRSTTMSHYKSINLNDDAPIVGVSWENAKAYCRWLSQKENKHYRLPTEAEWEYACRAGSQTKYTFGDDENNLEEYAWYNKNSNSRTHAIGTRKPNRWGLHDMHGNVWEWCEDVWVDNYDSTPRDGSANKMGNERIRVLRGGSWVDSSRYVRSTNRNGFDADGCDNDLGFRLVLDGENRL